MLEWHSDSINTVVFSPKGRLVASLSYDYTVRLWSTQNGGHVSTIPCSSLHPRIELRTGLGLIFIYEMAFESLSGKMKAVENDSSCPTQNLLIHAAGDWLIKSSERVLWLPSEYRAHVYTSYGNITVLR